ncbi:piggyBac transposable element-derived protein 1-like [Homalodisca vitripennis]|uniref:piggyBac transposable element-derived protein 1-like n=1 Tax=Homalodisca vitripennis TaxID=197043 RepID=UPI001EE9E96A|nr:piggyBac transposable element-derived protein 1-like [Homalodisca vitripennis]
MSNLHVCDNDNLNADDKYAKVRPLFDALNKTFFDYAPHEEHHSVDESMVPYFGRHGLKQFIRNKPIRYGYKIWVGATPNGYVVWKDPYQGSSHTLDPQYEHLGLGASVVLQYCDVLKKNGDFPYFLYFDNFFSGLPLFEKLSQKNIRAIGTVKRFSLKAKKHAFIPQPNLIHQYNKKMGGVDRCDQNMSLYRIQIRGKKWYFPLICDCIDSAEQNAWQLHRHAGGNLDHLSFRRRLACNLLETFGKGKSKRDVGIAMPSALPDAKSV